MWSTGNEPGLAGAAPSWFAFSTSAAGGGTQALSMNLNVGGSQYGCSTTLTEGSSYGVALTYDGANVKGWVGPTGSAGSLICTRPVVGTIVQSYFEDTTIGGGVTGWPPQATTTTVADAWLDSVRFSSVARYTSSYTPPTSKFTVDANTQLLLNFDTTLRNTVVGQAGGMPGLGATFAVYLPVRSPYPLPVGAVTLSGFGTYVGSSIGLFLGGTTLFHGSDLRIVSRNGIEVEGQAFTSSWNNVRVENFTDLGSDASAHNAVYGWSFNGSNGFTKLSNILQQGGAVSLASRPVTGPVEISNYDHVVTDDSRFSWMLWGNADGFDQVTLASSGTDFETGAPQYRGTVYLNGVSGFTSYGSILNSGGSWSGHSPVIWDLPSANGDQVTLSGTVLVCKTGDPCCIYREGANQFSLSPLGVRQRKTAAGIPLQCHGTGQP
jgi:hypothetical protein